VEFLYVMGNCISCQKLIFFNPHHVPSIRPYNQGDREPLCEMCFEKWKVIHNKPELQLHPEAYQPEEI
jgi:hypothetical protein